METLNIYLPQDRYRALLGGKELPDRTRGAVLFADISGFTPLTEALTRALGPRRGADELTLQLNHVYHSLIREVDRFGGSVISFAGDAITCWYDGDDGSLAIATALAMQAAMTEFATVPIPNGKNVALAMKASVASGPARRFIVGDPSFQLIDVLAGKTIERMIAGEQVAEKGDVVVDESTAYALAGKLHLRGWRTNEASGERFGVAEKFTSPVEPPHEDLVPLRELSDDHLRAWLLPAVYQRLRGGQGEFLTELRPALALFLKFEGIDFENDDHAGQKLSAYIRWVETVLARYEGTLSQLTIGDKGSHLFVAFGVPIAHEDDPWRAANAALDLRSPPAELAFISPPRIGISQGTMRVGSYGGNTRRTYGVLGDEVNLAARLMQQAGPGDILVSRIARQSTGQNFEWKNLPDIQVKGKAQPIALFKLLGQKDRQNFRLLEPKYALPMVGRAAELSLIEENLNLALAGHGQIVGITADAGMGKSRLIAEVIGIANERHLTGYGGQCQSSGTNTSYLVWWDVWRSFFGVDPAQPVAEQISSLAKQLAEINPALPARLPLLESVLNICIPDNELTRAFDAKLRKSSLESLLMECLRARTRQAPLLLVLEDAHWLDPLSHDLLEVVGKTISNLPVLLLIAYRPPELRADQPGGLKELSHFSRIQLKEFSYAEARELITLKLAGFYNSPDEVPPTLVEKFIARAEGNPFYIEELLNFLQDHDFNPNDPETFNQIDLPTSLHSLILSRMDQLTEQQKSTLKVASVIGRVFRANMLWGAYPQLGDAEKVKADLKTLSRLDVTALDAPEPELSYVFKHIVTQEVAYESLSYAMRAMLHNLIAQFIEKTAGPNLPQHIDLLAYHYDRSTNVRKKREYLLKAGEAAQANYANATAIDYYLRALSLLPNDECVKVMLKLGTVFELTGKWTDAAELYQNALAITEKFNQLEDQAWAQTAIGELLRKQGRYAESNEWLDRARVRFAETGNENGIAQVLHHSGTRAASQGDYSEARSLYEQSLALRRKLNDQTRIASLLSNLGIIARFQGDLATARSLYEQSLGIRRQLGDQWAIANSLNNLGLVCRYQGDFPRARALLEESVGTNRLTGDQWAIANSLCSLAEVALDQSDFGGAKEFLNESLQINRELGDNRAIAFILENFARLAAAQEKPDRAHRLAGAASSLRQKIGAPLSPVEKARLDEILSGDKSFPESDRATAWSEGIRTDLVGAIEYALQESWQGGGFFV